MKDYGKPHAYASHSDAVVSGIIARKPMHRKFLRRSIALLSAEECAEVEAYLRFLHEDGLSDDDIVSTYLTIVEDMFREELYFRENLKYRCSSFEEAAMCVYNVPDYMRHYMVGLALSAYWWPNHIKKRRFFFHKLPTATHGAYLEVGPGHGLYFQGALCKGSFDSYRGVDISATSVGLTRRLLMYNNPPNLAKATLEQGDFLTHPVAGAPVRALVMGEVLEHVEEPAAFLHKAFTVTDASSFIFVTTCINTPAVDHIYNPGTYAALQCLVQEAGFVIADALLTPRDGKTLEECDMEKLPVDVALVLAKPAL